MKFSALVLRLATLLVTVVFAVGLWSSIAQAQPSYSLSGNMRLQIGNGLPIPIGFTPAPNGAVKPTASATVIQITGPDPQTMILKDGALTIQPTPPRKIGLFPFNSKLFQVQTAVGLSFPGPGLGGTFMAGGRSGAQNLEFCGGSTVPSPIPTTWNPGCTNPANGVINGLVKYRGTATQFGGPGQNAVVGTANIAVVAAGAPACNYVTKPPCMAIFALASPAATGAQGAPFGFNNISPGTPPVPGIAQIAADAAGNITQVFASFGTGLTNAATSYGAPWTTGMVTISVPVVGETFVLSGSDARVNGKGSISLVSVSIANRQVSGPNANRGWLNLVVGNRVPVPALSAPGLAAAFGLLALAGGYALRRWFR